MVLYYFIIDPQYSHSQGGIFFKGALHPGHLARDNPFPDFILYLDLVLNNRVPFI